MKSKIKEDKWYEVKIKRKKGQAQIKTKTWVKGKDGLKWHREMLEGQIRMTKIIKPRLHYTSDYDIFSINWGEKKIDGTIETNLLGQGDLRFDVTKGGLILGIEIDDFSKILRLFDCDKKKNIKRIEAQYKNLKWKHTKKSKK